MLLLLLCVYFFLGAEVLDSEGEDDWYALRMAVWSEQSKLSVRGEHEGELINYSAILKNLNCCKSSAKFITYGRYILHTVPTCICILLFCCSSVFVQSLRLRLQTFVFIRRHSVCMERTISLRSRSRSQSVRKRLRCYNMNGELLNLFDHSYVIPRPFDFVSERRTLGEVFEAVSKCAQWPLEWIRLIIGDHQFEWPRLRRLQDHLRAPVMCYVNPDVAEIVATVNFRFPDNFHDSAAPGYCLCDFGGCCTLCNVPSCEICPGCGNNGCCRSDSCGHDCCAAVARGDSFQPRYLCPMSGCRPWWACALGDLS